MNLGHKLKQLREKSGLSQYQVADKLDISRSRYNSWENNIAKPRYDMLERISNFYSVDIKYIASEETSTNDLSPLLKELRGTMSLREAAKKIGISHTYLDSLENGDKRSGKPIKPTPDTLKLVSKAYGIEYSKLMSTAGYSESENNHFGQYLRELRKSKKLTIRQLEKSSGVSNSYLSQLENGLRDIPSPHVIEKLSEGLDASYEQLMLVAGYSKDPTTSYANNLVTWFGKLSQSDAEKLKQIWEVIKND
jgi:transcriptional regulator with XRE-family HTH domain